MWPFTFLETLEIPTGITTIEREGEERLNFILFLLNFFISPSLMELFNPLESSSNCSNWLREGNRSSHSDRDREIEKKKRKKVYVYVCVCGREREYG